MKKKWFIVLYIVLGVVTAFGQDAVGTSTDSKIVTEQAATTDRDQADGAIVPAQATGAEEAESPQENAAARPESEASASVSAADDGSTALPAAADALRLQIFDQLHTDTPIKFSDGLFSQKRPPEKSRAKKTAPDNRGAKGTQTTTKNAGLSTLLPF